MNVRRKFNLGRIGHQYESIEIEVTADTIEEALQKIEASWREFCNQITEKKIQ